jgi:hypothetical protein
MPVAIVDLAPNDWSVGVGEDGGMEAGLGGGDLGRCQFAGFDAEKLIHCGIGGDTEIIREVVNVYTRTA